MIELEEHELGIVFTVRAAPGAKRNAITGIHAGMLKVAVTQIAEKGKANQAIIQALAKQLGLRKSQIEILSGHTSQEKKFLIRDVSKTHLQEVLTRKIT